MTPKEYKNKMMVKVVGSTWTTSKEAKELIGEVSEVREWDYKDSTVTVFKKDETEWFRYKTSDVQIATPVMYEGINVCVLDKVEYKGYLYEVYDYIYQGEWKLCIKLYVDRAMMVSGDIKTYEIINDSQIEALDPLYKEVKEELAVGSEIEIKTENGKLYKATINKII